MPPSSPHFHSSLLFIKIYSSGSSGRHENLSILRQVPSAPNRAAVGFFAQISKPLLRMICSHVIYSEPSLQASNKQLVHFDVLSIKFQ